MITEHGIPVTGTGVLPVCNLQPLAQVASNLENALASADPEVEKLFIGAFSDVVLDPKYLTSQDENLQAVGATQPTSCMFL